MGPWPAAQGGALTTAACSSSARPDLHARPAGHRVEAPQPRSAPGEDEKPHVWQKGAAALGLIPFTQRLLSELPTCAHALA